MVTSEQVTVDMLNALMRSTDDAIETFRILIFTEPSETTIERAMNMTTLLINMRVAIKYGIDLSTAFSTMMDQVAGFMDGLLSLDHYRSDCDCDRCQKLTTQFTTLRDEIRNGP